MQEVWGTIGPWIEQHSGRILFFVIVMAVAAVLAKVTARTVRRLLVRSNIPSATIFVNILLAVIWSVAFVSVLQPVFGINPTTLWTALGIGGIAVSFGLKDTIANIVGGFGLMLSKVIQPGDIIIIQGVTGTVRDVTWRHTVVVERNGSQMWIPNSVLNTVGLEKIDPSLESLVRIPFVARADADLAKVEQVAVSLVAKATEAYAMQGRPPVVRFQGFNVNGVQCEVWVHARSGVWPQTIQDKGSRALAGQDFIAHL